MPILKSYKLILLILLSLSLNGCHHWFSRHGGHHGGHGGGHHGGHGRHFVPHSMNQIDLKNPVVKTVGVEKV